MKLKKIVDVNKLVGKMLEVDKLVKGRIPIMVLNIMVQDGKIVDFQTKKELTVKDIEEFEINISELDALIHDIKSVSDTVRLIVQADFIDTLGGDL